MTPCPSCSADNPPGGRFCRSCGKPLEMATVALSATQMMRGPQSQAFDVPTLFAGKERVVAGRAPDCDIRLDHPSVSRYHARFERRDGVLHVSDLGSVNGIFLHGKRVGEAVALRDGDKLGIGPYLLTIGAGKLQSLDSSRSLRLEARHLEKIVPVPGGTRKLLDDVSLVVAPGEFVALLGPSGSGKSTLMDCLNGRRRATSGLVLANGENFYRHFDSFRQSLGYVPQKDIVHTELTVERALLYTAKLRLPMDSDPAELRERLEDVLRKMELVPHRSTPVGQLSGGQIKRVSLGAELLGQPALLYIDEATSGLDAGTERRMMRLFRGLADEGRSMVCITHNVDNVEQCHLALILAKGKLLYYGPPKEAARWFKVPRLSDVYDRIAERPPELWEQEFRQSDLFREFVADRLAQPAPSHQGQPVAMPAAVPA
ncbi:MAG: ATP-binding cassette domain-containing protein, partial [Gemmataceae bacterium]|nr:ATP-binding cassette domain-containing protein [Gemmataceae bacterium]